MDGRPTQTTASGTKVLADRRPDHSSTFAAGIPDPLLRAVAAINLVEGLKEDGAALGDRQDVKGTVRHGVPPKAISFTTMATVRPVDDTAQEVNKVALTSHNPGINPEYLDAAIAVAPQHYSPVAISAAELPHDANYVSGVDVTAARAGLQPDGLTCEACNGSKRNYHFPARPCSFCCELDLGSAAL